MGNRHIQIVAEPITRGISSGRVERRVEWRYEIEHGRPPKTTHCLSWAAKDRLDPEELRFHSFNHDDRAVWGHFDIGNSMSEAEAFAKAEAILDGIARDEVEYASLWLIAQEAALAFIQEHYTSKGIVLSERLKALEISAHEQKLGLENTGDRIGNMARESQCQHEQLCTELDAIARRLDRLEATARLSKKKLAAWEARQPANGHAAPDDEEDIPF
ncbi:MAG: hypothetical protein M5R40_29590 [Anaerolineae bacterium]|nr:hypothetical protein [Anaerolineae bacterium]